MADPVYDEVAAFLAELVGGGMQHVVLSPGSRSTPLTIAAAAQPALTHWMQLDERTAGFFALGLAKATGAPVGLVCTSGTAAANYYPAVIEASRTGVPLVVISADRPPEAHGGWGSNQTIDQQNLFGSYPRAFVNMPVGGTSSEESTRQQARNMIEAATSKHVGPVHANWAFRKPLEPLGSVPAPAVTETVVGERTREPDANTVAELRRLGAKRGVVIAGPIDSTEMAASVAAFADAADWPILAEATSQLRLDSPSSNVIATADRLLSNAAVRNEMVADVVLFVGGTPTGTTAMQWAADADADRVLLIDPASPWDDAGPIDATTLAASPASVAAAATVLAGSHTAWLDHWHELDAIAADAISRAVDPVLCGPSVVRSVVESLPNGSHLMVANSMTVRDLDRYSGTRNGVRVHVSRGASGIDGLIATASGLAAADVGPVALLIGDIALLHDIGSLYAAGRLQLDLTIVLINDDGGGIFSMLPIATHGAQVDFNALFHTPHGTDFASLAATENVRFARPSTPAEVAAACTTALGTRGLDLLEAVVDHQCNLAVRQQIDAEIAMALQ